MVTKAKKKSIINRFLAGTISFGVLHTSLICCVLIQYFKDNGMLPLQLSIIIISKRILRLFCDTFFGIIFDRFGAKIVFLLGRLLKLTSYFILLYFPTFFGFIIAMLLDGASYSSIYGKISSYIYNNLSARRKLKLFPRAMSLYYFCTNMTTSMMSFFAGILLLSSYKYNIIIYISILTNILSICILIHFIPSRKISDLKFTNKSYKDIFVALKILLTQQKSGFLSLICFYGIISFMAWQFCSISSLILLDMGITSAQLAICGSVLKFTMSIGALMSFFMFTHGIKIRSCVVLLTLILLFGIISAIIYRPIIFYIFCITIVLVYTLIEVSIERKIEYFSVKTIRGTIISIATTFCSLIAISSNLFVGFIAQHYSYKLSLTLLLSSITIILLILIKKTWNLDKLAIN